VALYFFCAFLISGAINFICSVLVLRGLAEAGAKVSFFEIRWQVHKHLKTYRQITMDKNGSVAWPYYGYHCSLAGMVGFMILTLFSLKQ
jgi:hypothetical protein